MKHEINSINFNISDISIQKKNMTQNLIYIKTPYMKLPTHLLILIIIKMSTSENYTKLITGQDI